MGLRMTEKREITVDGRNYHISVLRKYTLPSDVPRLAIVSYQPNLTARELLKVCIRSIQKYTYEPHEIWVVDNCSPDEYAKWLLEYPNVNVVFNYDKYIEKGSYDNGVALEIAKNVIDPESKYLMTLHMDTMVCKEGWLTYLLSKFTKDVRAVGVRMDKVRTPEGILHILGAMFDFQLIRDLKLSFMPRLPDYDVGDLVTVGLINADYKVFACKNTLTDPDLIQKIPPTSIFRNLFCDRAFNDKGEVFFLHLGRGIGKSTGGYKDKGKTTPQQWIRFANNVVLSDSYNPNRLSHEVVSPLYSQVDYSLRRYYVDEFHERNIGIFPKSATVLDIGGKKVRKRGQFDIAKHPVKVKYVNINPGTSPDYLCDGSNIPVESNSFDAVICSEVLEHVREPTPILKEAFRVLKPGGTIFICVPFLFRIHPDPDDFCRYTDQYWRTMLKEAGFKNIMIEKQGSYPSVLVDMLRSYVLEMQKEGRPKIRILRWVLPRIVAYGKKKALELEQRDYFRYHLFFNSYTTGYGIIAIKPV